MHCLWWNSTNGSLTLLRHRPSWTLPGSNQREQLTTNPLGCDQWGTSILSCARPFCAGSSWRWSANSRVGSPALNVRPIIRPPYLSSRSAKLLGSTCVWFGGVGHHSHNCQLRPLPDTMGVRALRQMQVIPDTLMCVEETCTLSNWVQRSRDSRQFCQRGCLSRGHHLPAFCPVWRPLVWTAN